MTEKRGLTPRFFVAPSSLRGALATKQSSLTSSKRLDCFASLAMTVCRMFPNRPITAARIVLDDRSRLPWRFFGRLTTAALTA
jgi:hypothetical protein